jgi:hypothetical protein
MEQELLKCPLYEACTKYGPCEHADFHICDLYLSTLKGNKLSAAVRKENEKRRARER